MKFHRITVVGLLSLSLGVGAAEVNCDSMEVGSSTYLQLKDQLTWQDLAVDEGSPAKFILHNGELVGTYQYLGRDKQSGKLLFDFLSSKEGVTLQLWFGNKDSTKWTVYTTPFNTKPCEVTVEQFPPTGCYFF